jgi:hypothetical protein
MTTTWTRRLLMRYARERFALSDVGKRRKRESA